MGENVLFPILFIMYFEGITYVPYYLCTLQYVLLCLLFSYLILILPYFLLLQRWKGQTIFPHYSAESAAETALEQWRVSGYE